jgi:hypothetical protein
MHMYGGHGELLRLINTGDGIDSNDTWHSGGWEWEDLSMTVVQA